MHSDFFFVYFIFLFRLYIIYVEDPSHMRICYIRYGQKLVIRRGSRINRDKRCVCNVIEIFRN